MGLFLKKNIHGDYELNKGATAAAALATLVGGATLVDGVVFTTPEHTTLVLTAGKPDRFAPVGPSLKIPFWERTYKVKTSVSDVPLDEANIALQNGTVTAEHLQSTTRIQINGTLAEREQTVTMLREKMPDFQARIKAFSEKALRDVVRLTVVASEDSQESQEVTSVKNGNHMNFLDTKSVGAEVARIVQDQINSIIPGSVKQGDKDVPRLEVTEFQIGQFEFDKDYLSRRQKIADSRAKAEAARFEKAEAERKAEARAAQAEGERRAPRWPRRKGMPRQPSSAKARKPKVSPVWSKPQVARTSCASRPWPRNGTARHLRSWAAAASSSMAVSPRALRM